MYLVMTSGGKYGDLNAFSMQDDLHGSDVLPIKR